MLVERAEKLIKGGRAMIKETIKVEYLKNIKTDKMGFTLDEIAEPGQPGWKVDYCE